MEPTGLRTLNLRCSPVCLRPRSPIRPAFLSDSSENRPSPPPTPHKSSLFLHSAASPKPLSCSLKAVERTDANTCSNGSAGAVIETSWDKLLQVVLVSPQIPGNTGCIARTCAASAVGLHLVKPLGYKIEDSKLKRAGLDYWPYPMVTDDSMRISYCVPCIFWAHSKLPSTANAYKLLNKVHGSWAEFRDYFRQQDGEKRLLAFTKRGTSLHSDFSYRRGDWLVFGSETRGLPPEVLLDCSTEGLGGGTIRIPMVETYVRCLNLSVSVGIALYEASRQLNYEQLQCPPEAGSESQALFMKEDIFG